MLLSQCYLIYEQKGQGRQGQEMFVTFTPIAIAQTL
ncbi:hypothetical protein NIES2100_74100 [Calothrix sp. NIES-2100]|nr:hypothetical protein NIES2100_74100 [Calothrix sp. NIES-2100]